MRLTEQELSKINERAREITKRSVAVKSSGVKRWQALGRLPAGELNNTEKKFAAYLQEREVAGAIVWWKPHPFNVRLAANTFYRPDFIALLPTMEIVIYEVKGSYTSDKGQMKIKLCVEALPVFKVIKASLAKGAWQFEEF